MRLTKLPETKAKRAAAPKAKKAAVKKAPKKAKKKGVAVGMRVKVGSTVYESATAAFRQLKITKGLGTLRRMRKELHATGSSTVDKFKFKLVTN